MKKIIYIITAAVLSLVACTRNQEIDVPDANLSIFARTESPAESRTVVESGVHVYWEPGDEIAVFMGEESAKFTTDITAASGTATFKGTFGDTTWPEEPDLWAVYPFSEDATFDGETITTVLPSEQVAREGSFGKDMNLAIAHSSGTTLQFYNVGGGIRFSVSEEGIKKVMFEGLSGEIISGKVKIGMDENGKPVVKEVTGGSQFITLLPPTGQESFKPGTWYYIVAIPGTLEGGYKLRFYKDTDYAKKVSEKAVEVKRSIFGNIEKADEGIEYEAQTLHFPETEEEWKASIRLTNQIALAKYRLIDKAQNDMSLDEIAESLLCIDGVIAVVPNSSGSSISVLQKDSVTVVISLFNPNLFDNGTTDKVYSPARLRSSQGERTFSSPILKKSIDSSSDYVIREGGRALILAPFQKQFQEPLDDWYDSLNEHFHVDSLQNSHADIYSFIGTSPKTQKRLDNYDFIIISTHGSTASLWYPIYTELDPEEGDALYSTMLCTGTSYETAIAEVFISEGLISSNKDIAPFIPSGIDKAFVGFLPTALKDHSFNKSDVVLMACESAQKSLRKRKMVEAFLDAGASFVVGNDITMYNRSLKQYVTSMLTVLCNGLSVYEAHNYASKSDIAEQWSNRANAGYNAEGVPHPNGYSGECYNIYDHTLCFPEDPPVIDYYFMYPFPILETPQQWNGELRWSSNLSAFCVTWTFLDYWKFVEFDEDGEEVWGPSTLPVPYNYTISYSLYVDGARTGSTTVRTTDHKAIIYDLPPDDYKAYVIAQILLGDGNKEIASYKSNEISFTVADTTGDAFIEIPDFLDFECCPIGQSKSLSIDVQNSGDGTLTITDISIRDEDLSVSYNWTSASIAPGNSKELIVTITPLKTGPHNAYMDIYSNASNQDCPGYNSYLFGIFGQHASPVYSVEMVDLGLTVQWAACDLGTNSQFDYGELFAWGETERKSSYSWENYLWCNGTESSINKYTDDDGPRYLESADDAATAHLGKGWRIPTEKECQDLIDKCTWRAIEKNGIPVFEATSQINGKKIYFMRKKNSVGQLSDYWTNEIWGDESATAFSLCWYGNGEECNLYFSGSGKAYGALVRPVYDDK